MIPFMKAFGLFTKLKQFFFFFWKKKSKWPPKKRSFSSSANSQYFFVKISWIGCWDSRFDWCERHWGGSIYMVVRLSDISSKTGKKCIFGLFRLFLRLCRTASRPYKLSHINALHINQFYTSKNQSQKFSQKNIEN